MKTNPMNICLVRHREYGKDPRVRRDAEALVEAGYHVDVVCLQGPGEAPRETIGGVALHRLAGSRKRGGLARYLWEYVSFVMMAQFKVTRLFWTHRYAVVQVHTMPDFLVFAAFWARLLGAKVVLDLQEATPEFYQSKYGVDANHKLVRIAKWVEKLSAGFAHRLITIHTTMRGVFVSHGIPEAKMTCIHNVPDEQIFHCDEETAKEIPPPPFVCVSHGSILERYGLHIAVEAAHLARDRIPGLKMQIVGEGEYLEEVKALCERLQAGDVVEFLPFRPVEELPALISAAHVGLVPILRDIYTDLMHANKMFEYIAMRRPVVISRVNAVKEYFGEEELRFCDAGDARQLADQLVALYQDPLLRKTLADQAYQRYQSLRWDAQKQIYLNLIRELTAS